MTKLTPFKPSKEREFALWDSTALDKEKAGWLIAPCTYHRDAEIVERANWTAQKDRIVNADPSLDNFEVHTYNHWVVGWVKIMVIAPDTPAHAEAEKIANELEDYPLLCEDTYGEMCAEEEGEDDEDY
jgi:hypothetical protein